MTDLMIIELYFARDEKAIKETDTKYGKLCFSVANNILCNDEDSEECVNDTYLSVWNTIPPTRPNNFMAFICRITRNLSLKRLDFNKARKRTPNAIVSFSELEEILSDESIPRPEVGTDEVSKLISDFLRKEKEDARNLAMYLSASIGFSILSAILQHDTHLLKVKSRICCITLGTS